MDDKPSLFRQQALDHLNQSDQLDKLIRITSRKSWLVLLTFAMIITAVLLWSIFGNITQYVRGEGILLDQEGGVYSAIAPEAATRLIQLNVKLGDHVSKNGILARLASPDLEKQWAVSNTYLEKLRANYQTTSDTATQEIKRREVALTAQNAILATKLETEKKNLANLEALIQAKRELLKKGVVSRDDLTMTLQQYHGAKREIAHNNIQLSRNRIEATDFSNNWKTRLRDLNTQLQRQQHETDQLKEKLSLSKTVLSPVDGTVVSMQANIGDKIEPGEAILSIAGDSKRLLAMIYVPASEGKRVSKEMHALISPTNIKKEEFGSIIGEVTSVSSYPVTPQHIKALLQNDTLVAKFTEAGAPIALGVTLKTDNTTESGYKWSSKRGAELKVSPGTLVTALITVRKQAPISLLIPMLKKMLGNQ